MRYQRAAAKLLSSLLRSTACAVYETWSKRKECFTFLGEGKELICEVPNLNVRTAGEKAVLLSQKLPARVHILHSMRTNKGKKTPQARQLQEFIHIAHATMCLHGDCNRNSIAGLSWLHWNPPNIYAPLHPLPLVRRRSRPSVLILYAVPVPVALILDVMSC